MKRAWKVCSSFLLLFLITDSSLVYGWLSGEAKTPGPSMVPRILSPAESDNEHAKIMLKAFVDAGVPDELINALYEYDVYVNEEGSYLPSSFQEAGWYQTRRFNVSGMAALPDHAFSIWDFLSGYGVCPKGTTTSPQTKPTECHNFYTHMGAVNSNHFPPQAGETYRWYHRQALDNARACHEMTIALEDMFGKNSKEIQPFVKECKIWSLTLEAFGQHFLQDVWAVGHMWERWGSTDLSYFASPSRERAAIVALVAGSIHGCGGVNELCNLFGDEMSGGVNNGFVMGTEPFEIHNGIGDVGFDKVLTDSVSSGRRYSEQAARMFACAKSSAMEVYDALTGEHRNLPISDPTSSACLAQRNTNAALREGLGLSSVVLEKDVNVFSGVIKMVARSGSDITLTPELERDFEYSTKLLALFLRVFARDLPNGTDLASGNHLPNFMGVLPNGNYRGASQDEEVAPVASFADPDTVPDENNQYDPGDIDTSQPGVLDTRKILQRGFHRAHAKSLCSDPEADPTLLKQRADELRRDPEPGDREPAIAVEVCEIFAARHMQVDGEPSICEVIGGGGPTIRDFRPEEPYSSTSTPVLTEREYYAKEWCSDPCLGTVEVNGRRWKQPCAFRRLTRAEIDAACPSGICRPKSALNGIDMTGWKWATEADMIGLFNYYIGTDVLSESVRRYQQQNPSNHPLGYPRFTPTVGDLFAATIFGRVSDSEYLSEAGGTYFGFLWYSLESVDSGFGSSDLGAWFNREIED